MCWSDWTVWNYRRNLSPVWSCVQHPDSQVAAVIFSIIQNFLMHVFHLQSVVAVIMCIFYIYIFIWLVLTILANICWCNKPSTTTTCISSPCLGRSTTLDSHQHNDAVRRRLVVDLCGYPPHVCAPTIITITITISISALCQVPNYTTWWQRHMDVNMLALSCHANHGCWWMRSIWVRNHIM